jgi:hypothetical protein
MTTAERQRNLAKARKVRAQRARAERRSRDSAHRVARRAYRAANDAYYKVLRTDGEGSPAEKRAFRRMINAEVEWFNTFPKDGERG